MQKPIETRITAARTRLLLDFPWFGSLAMRLKIEQSPDVKTFATDGTRLIYNPATATTYTDAELTGVMAHEVMHCALLHPYRRANRDAKLWNVATDYAINSELIRSGLKLPANVLIDAQFDGLSADVIYARLQKQQQQHRPDSPSPTRTDSRSQDRKNVAARERRTARARHRARYWHRAGRAARARQECRARPDAAAIPAANPADDGQ